VAYVCRLFRPRNSRHTNATELLRNGVPIAEVSRRLGHADQNITLSIYSHAVPADSRAAAKVWNDALGDVIQTSKRPAAAQSVAESCTDTTTLRVFVGNKRRKMAGTTGLEPATSDVTGRWSARNSSGTTISANAQNSPHFSAFFDTAPKRAWFDFGNNHPKT